jgi:tetratricopeptide (TPR) repeat protein
VVEERIACDLGLGRHAEVAGELAGLVAQFPWQERLAALLMTALYRCGRRGEALAVFDQTRRTLAEELGLDPGPELTQIQAKVLADDPSLGLSVPAVAEPTRQESIGLPTGADSGQGGEGRGAGEVAAVVPRQLPAGAVFFAGREEELKSLAELLSEPSDPSRPSAVVVTAVTGMAGAGKTALAVHWAREVADRFPDGQLYVNLRGHDGKGAPLNAKVVTGWFLAALGIPAPAIPAKAPARTGLYRSTMAGRRVLIVLDNAKDAAQVRPLLAGGPGCLVVITSRSSLAGLAATDGARLVRLGVLGQAEAVRMLEARLGRERVAREPTAVGSLIRLCAGLPLALAVMAARAAEFPDLPLSALAAALASEPARLDALDTHDEATSLRAVFSWSYRQLSNVAAQMFALLGVHGGPDISVHAAASLAGMPAGQARAALAELVGASLITEHQPGRYLLHELLRAYAAEQAATVYTETEIRSAVRRSLDHYLQTMTVMPSFWAAAFTVGPPRLGVSPERLADDAQLLAWLRAEHQVLLHAVEQATEKGFDTEAWQICFFFGFSAYQQGKWADWNAAGRIALAAATRAGGHEGQGWAHCGMGYLHWFRGGYGEATAWFRQALEHFQEAADSLGQSVAHTGITGTLLEPAWAELGLHRHQYKVPSRSPKDQRRAGDGLHHAQQALVLHRQLGHHTREANTLSFTGCHRAILGDFAVALETCKQALAVSRGNSYLPGQAFAWHGLSFVHRLCGEFRAAIECCEQSLSVLREVGPQTVLQRAEILADLGDAHEAVGSHQAAHQAWREALDIFEDLHLHIYAKDLRARLNTATAVSPR